jgi:hypothetical protein
MVIEKVTVTVESSGDSGVGKASWCKEIPSTVSEDLQTFSYCHSEIVYCEAMYGDIMYCEETRVLMMDNLETYLVVTERA